MTPYPVFYIATLNSLGKLSHVMLAHRVVRSGVHGYWLGSYEYSKRKAAEALIGPGAVVFDVGAHVGYYTLLASVLTGAQGHIFAFEPLPRNLFSLKEHLRLNGIANASVIEAAVSDRVGTGSFGQALSSFMGHLLPEASSGGTLQVKVITLDAFVFPFEQRMPAPDCIKIDVEGAEMEVLSGARKVLAAGHPKILLATHSRELHQRCCALLRETGYTLMPVSKKENIEKTDEIIAIWEHRRF
jgi:FkbM family methyltransferase